MSSVHPLGFWTRWSVFVVRVYSRVDARGFVGRLLRVLSVVALVILVRFVINIVPRLVRRVAEVQASQVCIVGWVQVVTGLVFLESRIIIVCRGICTSANTRTIPILRQWATIAVNILRVRRLKVADRAKWLDSSTIVPICRALVQRVWPLSWVC